MTTKHETRYWIAYRLMIPIQNTRQRAYNRLASPITAGNRLFVELSGSMGESAILDQLVANPIAIPPPELWSRHRLTEAIIHAPAPSRAGTELKGR